MAIRSVKIRPMAAGDVPRVTAIEAACFGAEAWPAEVFRELVRAYRQARPLRGALWVAHDATTDAILGYAGVEISALRGEADVINIAVDGACRRRGVGQALMAQIVGFCRRQGVEILWLRVRASNRGARRFYRYLGFAERGRFGGYYREPDEPAVIMAVEMGAGAGGLRAPRRHPARSGGIPQTPSARSRTMHKTHEGQESRRSMHDLFR
jgi:ribosomal-protein-alanine N-acetyltransferase